MLSSAGLSAVDTANVEGAHLLLSHAPRSLHSGLLMYHQDLTESGEKLHNFPLPSYDPLGHAQAVFLNSVFQQAALGLACK